MRDENGIRVAGTHVNSLTERSLVEIKLPSGIRLRVDSGVP
jgi:hypothetical protein